MMMAGQLEQAQALLQRSAIINWETQVVRADIAAFEGRWQLASNLYNQALSLINNPLKTPQAPNTKIIQNIFQLASEAQILAGTLDGSRYSTETEMLDAVRGFKPGKLLIPVQFKFNSSVLNDKGKKSAQQLIKYINQHNFKKITLVGHTDTKGSNIVNDRISKQRALALKRYLITAGINIPIIAIGRGKREALILDDADRYTKIEIDALNRRVEVITE
jgi:outer membrane protein OmpA-like peptidoglycan-associated protein